MKVTQMDKTSRRILSLLAKKEMTDADAAAALSGARSELVFSALAYLRYKDLVDRDYGEDKPNRITELGRHELFQAKSDLFHSRLSVIAIAESTIALIVSIFALIH